MNMKDDKVEVCQVHISPLDFPFPIFNLFKLLMTTVKLSL